MGSINKVLDLFFSKNLDMRQRMFFIVIAIIICVQSLSNVVPYRQYFDVNDEHLKLSAIWGYANDLSFDYRPFKHATLAYAWRQNHMFNSAESPIANHNAMIQAKLRALGDDIPHSYYLSQYWAEVHVSAFVIKMLGIKDLKIIKALLYFLFLSLSVAVILLLLLHLYNRYETPLPLLLVVAIWPFVETDISIGRNFGLSVLPLLLFVIYLSYYRHHKAIDFLRLWAVSSLLFSLIAFHSYDFMVIEAASFVAIYLYFAINNQKTSLFASLKNTLSGLIVVGLVVVGLGVLCGLCVVLAVHIDMVGFDALQNSVTKRSVVGNAADMNHYRPSVLVVLQKSAVPLLFMFILPASLMILLIKEQQKYLLIFVLFLPLLGGITWLLLFPDHRNHVPQFEQALYYGMLPMLLLVASHQQINDYVNDCLQKLLK
ncbi:MAG: hypothetical protein K0U39_00920 [Alphaproteobacteria bacterium]|nr:hypothetical protein [Alphaproteobacteria bacterium]